MDKLKLLLTSRKFWAAFVGLALIIIKTYKSDFPISEAEITNLVYVLIAYILGTAIEDGAARIGVPPAAKTLPELRAPAGVHSLDDPTAKEVPIGPE